MRGTGLHVAYVNIPASFFVRAPAFANVGQITVSVKEKDGNEVPVWTSTRLSNAFHLFFVFAY